MNNAFVAAGDPIARYVKTVDHPITGWRLSPEDNKQVEFILSTPTTEFDYDTAVLEFYNERDLRFFLQRNKYLIENGLVKIFTGEAEPVDTTNLLTDDQVQEIATTRTPAAMIKRLSELTSDLTVKRVLAVAKEIGRPAKMLTIIEERLQQLSA